MFILPILGTAEQIKAWQQLATAWSRRYKNVELLHDNQIDNEIKALPDGVAVWLLGWNNELLKDQQQYFSSQYLTSTSQTLSGDTVTIDKQQLYANKHAVVLLDADKSSTLWGSIGANDPEVIALLARRLPHYSSYGVLSFELPEVNNIIKQHLPVLKSPMAWKLDQYN